MASTKTFNIITAKPTKNHKYAYLYNNKNNGGKSLCINGKPTDKDCNVLCNCVGWACARFNHIYNELTGYSGIKYPNFCCNAENFIEVAKKYGLSVGQTPKVGAIMVWQKGDTLSSNDGAGHVAVVEKVFSTTKVLTSESGYNSFAFSNKTREKGSNKNWGSGNSYSFRGFIYNPAVNNCIEVSESATEDDIVPNTVERNTSVNQIQVLIKDLRVRKTPSLKGECIGCAKVGIYNYISTKVADNYTWYEIESGCWVAYNKSWITLLEKSNTPKETTQKLQFKIGDTVSISYGAPIYGRCTKFAPWVYNATLYVRMISGNKITVSTFKSGPITGSVDSKYLIKKCN